MERVEVQMSQKIAHSEIGFQGSFRLLSLPFSYNFPVASNCVCILKSESCIVAKNNIMYSYLKFHVLKGLFCSNIIAVMLIVFELQG